MAARKKYKRRKKASSQIDLKIIGTIVFSVLFAVLLYTNSANLQKYLGKKLEGLELNAKRAEVIKTIVKE